MKTKNILYSLMSATFLLVLAACSKGEGEFLYKADVLHVAIKGYNGGNDELVVKIDNFKYELRRNSTISLSDVYRFTANQSKAALTITEKGTGKLVLERELKKDDEPVKVSLFYMDGKVSAMPEVPAVEAGRIKAIYMLKPIRTNYTEPVDIVAGRYWSAPNDVFEEFARIKNVKPNEFSEPITLSTFSTAGGQQYNGVVSPVSLQIRIYRAGTNEPYTNGSGYQWHVTSSPPPKPLASTASSKLYIIEENPSGTQMRFRALLTL
jgi:hypothetical protein